MINLYIPTNTDFTNNGDATLQPLSCEIKQIINGAWRLNMELPYDPEGRYKLIDKGATLRVTDIPSCSEISTTQLYRIYNYKRNTKSLTVIAFPKAMESTFDAPISQIIMNSDVTGISAASTLNGVSQKYTVQSDVEATGRAVWTNTNLNKAIAGSDENSFINVWGGEVAYDNTTIKILEQLGDDSDPAVVMYGKNISEISYEVDDSGMMTRIYPLSKDGIRYNDNGTEYIDSDKILDYPIVHASYVETPYKLIEDDASSVSRTAQKTADIKQRIQTKASQLSHSIWNTAVSNGWKIDYLASIYKDIIENIQNMVTANYVHDDFIKVVKAAVQAGMEWMKDQVDPEWYWIEDQTDAWMYGNPESGRYARNEWQYVDKKWRWFGDDYYWQQPKDDDSEWTWYENQTTHKKWYGTQDRYYLKGQYIYITEDGTLKKYWLDGDGWYDSDKTDESDWDWHESSSASGAWWFGDEDGDNYMSGQWAFIDGTLYWFDDNGYYYGVKEEHPPFDWMQSGEAFWFGNPDHSTRSYWLKSQWAKIDRQWYRFDSSGYVEDIYTEALTMFHNGMNDLTTLVTTCNDECYALLFDLMEEWTEKQYANGVDVPTVTINVDMVDLSKTVEYKNYQQLEQIHLGDSVKCLDYVHAIASLERVVELTYDVLRGYNTAITIGVANSSVGSMLSGSTSSGSGSGYNSAINVEVIEQNISQKNPTLVQGKNVTLTNNVDGTQTIDVDEPIRQGDNVTVTHNSDGSYTISAEGGALEYWIEENTKLYRKKEVSAGGSFGWDCDSDFKWINDGVHYAFYVTNGNNVGVTSNYDQSGTEAVCYGFAFVNGVIHGIGISAQETLMFHIYYSGNARTEPFTYNGVTLYWARINTGATRYEDLNWQDQGAWSGPPTSGRHFPIISGNYESDEDARTALIQQAHFFTKKIYYTGMSIDSQTLWGGVLYGVGDLSETTPQQMTFYVTDDGIVNAKNYKLDGTLLENIFQKILTAGNNIQIASDGKTISATDTNAVADMTDVDIDDQTLADGQVLKYNSTTERWENGRGGSLDAEEMTSTEYNLLPTADKQDASVVHFVNDSQEEEIPLDFNDFEKSTEGSMSISVVNDELVYAWNGGGYIRANAYYPTAIPSNIKKIKFKLTTGATSYYTNVSSDARWQICIGVKASYSTSDIYPTDNNWLVNEIYNTANTVIEGELDLSEIDTNCYLMMCAKGWNLTWNEIVLVEEQTGATKIMYKDVAYGEGSDVEPNPSGTPTDTLTTIGIDGTIYDIAGSGGSGGITKTELYSATSYSASVTLNDSIDNYDFIVMMGVVDSGGKLWKQTQTYYTSKLSIGDEIGFSDDGSYTWYTLTSKTQIDYYIHGNNRYSIWSVVGLKSGGGGESAPFKVIDGQLCIKYKKEVTS